MAPPSSAVEPSAAPEIAPLLKVVAEISALPECRGPLRRPYSDLARRLKLMAPLFEELKEGLTLGEQDLEALRGLRAALLDSRALLQSINEGSKLYQALHREDFGQKFMEVTEKLETALSEFFYDKLDMPEEVKEQIQLIHAQFKRARRKVDSPDLQLARDLQLAMKNPDVAILRRISEKLELRTINDMKKETSTLSEMLNSNEGTPDNSVEDMLILLKKLKDCVLMENRNVDTLEHSTSLLKLRSPVIPDDFRCPISLELMKDPVIVSTGQTYERASIQKWLSSGHKTCPKTQQPLTHMSLTPNYILKSLIGQWCESNGVDLPKQQSATTDGMTHTCKSECDRAGIDLLLHKLNDGNEDERRAAAGQLRLLAKRNADNRICIAAAGAVPLLVRLLFSRDPRTQEHAVTALLNLSINEGNKVLIVDCGAVPEIVKVLRSGSMEARENAAATLFSLSVIDDYKLIIGDAGAIPALINLLCEGSQRGKKDAATALFNLCIKSENKVKAASAGIVTHLMKLLLDTSGGMMDEALAILAILATHESKRAVTDSNPIPTLITIMQSGSPRNRENAAALLLSLCHGDEEQLRITKESGAQDVLKELCECGTDRAKRKATGILDLISKMDEAHVIP